MNKRLHKTNAIFSVLAVAALILCLVLAAGCEAKKNEEVAYTLQEELDEAKLSVINIYSDDDREDIRQIISPSDAVVTPGKIWPNNFDYALAAQKGLAEDGRFNNAFFRISALYRAEAEQYLLDTFNLARYESMIQSSGLDFEPKPLDWQSIYQKYSSLGLSYIYLRNNFYIERLSVDQLRLLDGYLAKDSSVTRDEVRSLVEETFASIIKPASDEYLKKQGLTDDMQMFGYDDMANAVPNNTLVFCISYYPSDELYQQQKAYLQGLAASMSAELSSSGIGLPISVFIY